MKKKKKRRKILKYILIISGAVIAGVIVMLFVFSDNKTLDFEKFSIENEKINGQVKIIHLSDMHFPKIEVDIDELIKGIKNENPDLIVITGDIISRNSGIESCGVFSFLDKLYNTAPVFYVNGNHEDSHENSKPLYDYLKKTGVKTLRDESVNITLNNNEITIIGLNQNTDYSSSYIKDEQSAKKNFKILLSHRPEKWNQYTSDANEIKPDLILSGHAHGGQIRIFKQGLVAPDQGLFPKYASGLYKTENNDINMIVSRGIGNSILPMRVNNLPHIPVIVLRSNA